MISPIRHPVLKAYNIKVRIGSGVVLRTFSTSSLVNGSVSFLDFFNLRLRVISVIDVLSMISRSKAYRKIKANTERWVRITAVDL